MVETPAQLEQMNNIVIEAAPKEAPRSWQERIGIKELLIDSSFAKDRYNT